VSHFRFQDFPVDEIERLALEFRSAQPFRHLVLHDMLVADPELGDRFPDDEWPGWKRYEDAYQAGKAFCNDIETIPEPFRSMIQELSTPRFLSLLEAITGEEGLIPDPYLEGGGLHCSVPGGVLAPHTDFHVYRRLELYRRINLLLYLNPEWEEDFGGCLELWPKGGEAPLETVVPRWGTCVIFLTDDRSVHGFSGPVHGATRRRQSIALYYYTSQESPAFSGDTTTYWQQHGELTGIRRARFLAYRALLFVSRAFSFAAHRANPNVGLRRPPR
jgi:hypothetical protein